MKIPVIHGVIDRRILVNYQVDPEILARVLPPPFRPHTVRGAGIVGVCLIRLRQIKPRFLPGRFGFASENAAHRMAVEWTDQGATRVGVFIPRRDSSSRLNTLVGGRLFPGTHQHATFSVAEHDDYYQVRLESDDHKMWVSIEGRLGPNLPATSVFSSLPEASAFFEAGALGYSATPQAGVYDGLELRSLRWKVEPLAVERIESSYFEDEQRFPKGSLKYDCALLMRGIQHEWHGREALCYPAGDEISV